MYKLIRPLLFWLDPEVAHDLSIFVLSKWARFIPSISGVNKPCQHMGLTFNNPVGLAAGLDKNATCLSSWPKLGFGFAEVGTITPRPQVGNPKPRLFRLTKDRAIINRMGFNGLGWEFAAKQLKRKKGNFIVGVNIGKNKDTSNERAAEDYQTTLTHLYAYADYFTINISSPNTPNLRALQQQDELNQLLLRVSRTRDELADAYNKTVPLMVKIAPDLHADSVKSIADVCIKNRIQGIIATNTTIGHREHLDSTALANEVGGLSGAPLFPLSTKILATLKQHTGDELTLIGVGGILGPEDAREKFQAGADLIQIYTGLIYEGPHLVKAILKSIETS